MGNTLFAMAEKCFEIASEHVRPREDLTLTQEEADTGLLLHAFDAANNGYGTVVASSENTDEFFYFV